MNLPILDQQAVGILICVKQAPAQGATDSIVQYFEDLRTCGSPDSDTLPG